MALSGSLVDLGTIVAIYALLTLGLNIKFGYNGLLDIGHVAFFLIGAYTTALLVLAPDETQRFARYILGWNLPARAVELTGTSFAGAAGWLVAILAGTVLAGVAGMLVALPAIRLREDYLAIAVLGISVIVKRVVQTENWLANGPDALKGWSGPVRDLFALPGSGVESALMLGIVVFAFWTIGASLIGTLRERPAGAPDANPDPDSNPNPKPNPDPTPGGRVVDGLFAVTTLGVGYLAGRRTWVDGRFDWRPPAVAGLAAGAVATGMALGGLGELAVLLFIGLSSLFAWVLGGALVARHYGDVPVRDVLLGLGLAVAFVVVFLPLIVLGGGDEATSTVGMLVTGGLVAAFIAGVYYLANNWSRFGHDAPFVSVVGLGAVWLFVLRYFGLALVTPFKRSGVAGALLALLENLLWLVNFTATGLEFNYARFLFVLAVGTLAVAYYVAEVTARSPFGRVLRAIREDEDVATALGKDAFSFKVQSMVLGSAMAGLAGGLFAIHIGALQHLTFAPRVTFVVFLMVIIGGTANNRGVILGALIFWVFQKATVQISAFFPTAVRSQVQALRLAFIGALLIVILYYRPQGIWGEKRMATAGGEEE